MHCFYLHCIQIPKATFFRRRSSNVPFLTLCRTTKEMTDNSWSLAFQGIIFTLLLAPTLFLFGADSTRSSRWPCRFQHEQSHDFFFLFFLASTFIYGYLLFQMSCFISPGLKKVQSQLNSQIQCWTLRKLYPFWGGHKDRRDAEIHLLSEEDFAEAVPPFLNCFCPSISTSLHSGKKRK